MIEGSKISHTRGDGVALPTDLMDGWVAVYSVWSVGCGLWSGGCDDSGRGWTQRRSWRSPQAPIKQLSRTLHRLLHLASIAPESSITSLFRLHLLHPSSQSKDNLPTPCPGPNNSGPPPNNVAPPPNNAAPPNNSGPPPNNSGPPNLERLLTTTFAPNGFP